MEDLGDQSSGSIIGEKYRLGPVLGRGGMGVVREASHVRLGTKFAIKLMHESADQLDRSRFEREALAASALHNRHVVRVFDVGETPEGTPFMVMELLRGRDVMAVYRDEPQLETSRVVDWMMQVCSAMYEAHAAGIVHRDLKPSNMFLVEGGTQELVKVVDFGISKVLSAKELTLQASFVGTPQYMAPEQLRGESTIDHRADLWAMGVILYRLLARQYPFKSDENASPIVAALANLTATPTPLEEYRPDLPEGLVAAVMCALSRDPADRFVDARAMAHALLPFGSGSVQFEEPGEDNRSQLLDRLHDATPMFLGRTPPARPPEPPAEDTIHVSLGGPDAISVSTSVPPPRSRALPIALLAFAVVGIGAAVLAARLTAPAADASLPQPATPAALAPAAPAPSTPAPAISLPALDPAPNEVAVPRASVATVPSVPTAPKSAPRPRPSREPRENPSLPTHL